jgi:hypothetical protein
MDSQQYGPLALIVALAGNLGAAAVAFRMAFSGKLIWEPKVSEFSLAPTRIVNVFVIVGIATMFFGSRGSGLGTVGYWAIALGLITFIFFLLDVLVRSIVIVRCGEETVGVIGGFWLTKRAREILGGEPAAFERGDLTINPATGQKQKPPTSISDFFCNNGRNIELTWSRGSHALASVTLVFVYCTWLASAMLGVGAASIVLEKAIR